MRSRWPGIILPLTPIWLMCWDQGRLVEAEKHLRLALDMQPNNRMIRSNLLFATIYSHTVTPEQLYADHCVYGRMISAMAGPSMHLSRDLSPQPRGIGFVSADLFHHAVSYFVEPVWDGLRERGCTVLAYYNGKHYDGATARLRQKCDVWRDVVGMPDAQLAQQIVDDEVDVLIDLSGHTGGNRLPVFAREPAPLQVTWLGHPATTGLCRACIGGSLMYADPPGMTEHLNTERLYRMPEVFYLLSSTKGLRWRSNCRLSARALHFLAFNNFAKVTPPVIACWGGILRQLPQSRLLLEVHGAEDVALPPIFVSVLSMRAHRQHRSTFCRVSLASSMCCIARWIWRWIPSHARRHHQLRQPVDGHAVCHPGGAHLCVAHGRRRSCKMSGWTTIDR